VILTSVVDAIEDRHLAVIDVPNAFIQTVVEDKKHVKLFLSEACSWIFK
jgi:hypothetical protein